MKRIIDILLLIPYLFMFASCEIDNYDGPDASFSGIIKDVVTGEKVGTDILNGSTIRAYELGWETLTAQTWVIKNTGDFQNDMVFAARYDLEFINGNFFPFTVENFEITKGKNEHDFEVTPYIRIKDASIALDNTGKRVVATFSLEGGKPEVRVSSVRLYAFTDIYVGEQVKFDLKGSSCHLSFTPSEEITASAVHTLSI
ncbi:MAG: DUF3823 domain-containing protein, partial [Tannerellaceae bacterium]|nr:DUF3823 domain-containing protein [Tannerellaceae bacterium]